VTTGLIATPLKIKILGAILSENTVGKKFLLVVTGGRYGT